MKIVRLRIEGMSCGHCVNAVEQALNSVTGVEKVEVNLDSGQAKVSASAEAETAAMIKAVEEEGYTASVED